jgi:hypothetical protein
MRHNLIKMAIIWVFLTPLQNVLAKDLNLTCKSGWFNSFVVVQKGDVFLLMALSIQITQKRLMMLVRYGQRSVLLNLTATKLSF